MHKLALSFGCLVLSSTCLAQSTNWYRVTTKNSPPPRWSHGMAHDLIRGRTVIFAGSSPSSTYMNDTWEFDGKDWMNMTPKTKPPVRRLPGLVYDVARVKTLMFGGRDGNGKSLNDTWVWDGKDWKQVMPKTVPPGRYLPALAYDLVRRRTVMFGGMGSGATLLNDTWEWDGVNWTQIKTTNAPSPRYTEIVYDTARRKVVLFGGSGYRQDTWEYDGKDWTQVIPKQSPSGRCCLGMAYDQTRQRTVIFGALVLKARWVKAETWEYDGKTWVQMKTANQPSDRYDFDYMVYDQRRKRCVLFGGFQRTGTPQPQAGDTWEYMATQPLTGTPSSISIATGGTHAFSLDAGTANANRLYWILGSLTGTSPGVTLASAVGSVTIPLNPDIWTDITIALANSSMLNKTQGTLDGSGKGTATFNIPKITNRSAIGVKFYHAALVYDSSNNFYLASNPVDVTLVK